MITILIHINIIAELNPKSVNISDLDSSGSTLLISVLGLLGYQYHHDMHIRHSRSNNAKS